MECIIIDKVLHKISSRIEILKRSSYLNQHIIEELRNLHNEIKNL